MDDSFLVAILPVPLPALKVALAGSVETQGAHEGDSGEESQAGGANLGHVALVSDLGESSGAGEFLLRGGGHVCRLKVDGEWMEWGGVM